MMNRCNLLGPYDSDNYNFDSKWNYESPESPQPTTSLPSRSSTHSPHSTIY